MMRKKRNEAEKQRRGVEKRGGKANLEGRL